MELLLFLQKLERSPARVDLVDDAVALRDVQVGAALRTETAAFGSAEGLHRDRHLDSLLHDGRDGDGGIVVIVRVEVVTIERDLRGIYGFSRVEEERKLLVVGEVVRSEASAALQLAAPA